MLIQFNFKNYKSFKGDGTLDLTATKESDLAFHIRECSGDKILPVATIYGANASGKSNVQDALQFMTDMVLRSLNFGEESKDEKYFRPMPFLFDEFSKNNPSVFEVYFTMPNDEKELTYNYGFSLDDDGVVEEWLNTTSKTGRKPVNIFYRERGNTLELGGLQSKVRDNLEIAITDKTLIVSLGAKLKIDKLRSVFLFFASLEFTDFGHPMEDLILSTLVPHNFESDESVRKDVIKFFSSFDNSIVDFRVECIKDSDDESKRKLKIDAGHRIQNSDDIFYISLKNESAGTLKMFALYSFVQDVLKDGGVLFVDELNARLHPLLVRAFVQLFLDPALNPNNAQLIFTSHDSWQLNNGTFRRDEIWFAEKNGEGESRLYSLADFVDSEGRAVRNDENLEKNYLLGKYGGIPQISSFEMFLGRKDNA